MIRLATDHIGPLFSVKTSGIFAQCTRAFDFMFTASHDIATQDIEIPTQHHLMQYLLTQAWARFQELDYLIGQGYHRTIVNIASECVLSSMLLCHLVHIHGEIRLKYTISSPILALSAWQIHCFHLTFKHIFIPCTWVFHGVSTFLDRGPCIFRSTTIIHGTFVDH